MIIERKWAMPNKHTFLIKPIDDFIKSHLPNQPALILDPFANRPSDYGAITNDLNPNTKVQFHMCALDFLRQYDNYSVDMVLFDPPYSLRQVKECYSSIGKALTGHESRHFYSDLRDEISRVLRIGGVCLSFGWSTNGIGMSRYMHIEEVLIVPHGGIHHDTLCTKEVKR